MYPLHLAGPISGRRAYTDPISNATANNSVNPFEIIHELSTGRLGAEYFNVVLHETTHYSSFLLPVGSTLAALMAAHTASPIHFMQDQDKVEGPAQIAIKAEVLSIYFAPLLEGLALFAEFDAMPGASPVASTVSSVALRLFCMSDYTKFVASGNMMLPYDYVSKYIGIQRIGSDSFERKISLLRQPFSSDDGYLLGYLWVKALWRILIGRTRKVFDTDLFLCFIIDYFFNDYQLASLLFEWLDAMRSTVDLQEYVESIEYYVFGERLNKLVEHADDYVEQYERHASGLAPGQIGRPGDAPNRPTYQNYYQQAEMNLDMSLAMGSLRSMHIMWPKFLASRHILRLFVAPADIDMDENGDFTAVYGDGKKYVGKALDVARPVSRERVSGQGSIEAVLLTSLMKPVICIFLGYEVIATLDIDSGIANDEKTAEACDRLSSYLGLEAAAVQIAEERSYREGSRAEQLADSLRGRAKQKTLEFYSNLGLGSDKGGRPSESVINTANAGGVAKLLQPYPGCLEWLARLSLSAGGRVIRCEEAASHWGCSAEEVAQWLAVVNSTTMESCQKEAFAVVDGEFGLGQF